MPTPVIHDYPVKRPGFIQSASWVGDPTNLKLRITYPDQDGVVRALEFSTRNAGAGRVGEICIATSTDVNDLGPRIRDILVAHTRMACMVAGQAVPGSQEFLNAFTQEGTNDLQTAIGGAVKISAVSIVNDERVMLTWRKGTGPTFAAEVDHAELNLYSFAPDTQLLIIPGSVKKQFPTYVHDYPNTLLTEERQEEIATYVMGLIPWI